MTSSSPAAVQRADVTAAGPGRTWCARLARWRPQSQAKWSTAAAPEILHQSRVTSWRAKRTHLVCEAGTMALLKPGLMVHSCGRLLNPCSEARPLQKVGERAGKDALGVRGRHDGALRAGLDGPQLRAAPDSLQRAESLQEGKEDALGVRGMHDGALRAGHDGPQLRAAPTSLHQS